MLDQRAHRLIATVDAQIARVEIVVGNGDERLRQERRIQSERVQRGLRRALFLAGDAPLLIVGHQAINRVLLSLFLRQRSEDVPYIYIPQNQYYHISLTPHRKVFERVPYERTGRD